MATIIVLIEDVHFFLVSTNLVGLHIKNDRFVYRIAFFRILRSLVQGVCTTVFAIRYEIAKRWESESGSQRD